MGDISSNNQRFELEEALKYVGGFGRFQHLLLLIVYITHIPAALQVMIVYFTAHEPKWKCVVNSTICILNGTLNPSDRRKCEMPRKEWYYTEPKEYSLVTQFDISCDDEWLMLLIASIFFVGWIIGSIVLGIAADKFGRKKVFFASICHILLIGIIRPYQPNIYLIFVCRLQLGFFFPGVLVQGFVLVSETLATKNRPVAGFLPSVVPLSFCLLALKAYFVRRWKDLYLVTTAPYLFVVFFYRYVPESLCWLEKKGNQGEIISILRRIAYWNNKVFPSDVVIILTRDTGVRRISHKDIFKSRKVIFQTLTLAILWLAIFAVAYGLQFAANDLDGSFYRNFAIIAAGNLPGFFVGVLACRKFGKKKIVLASSVGVVLICVSIGFIPADIKLIKVILGFGGQCLNTTTITVMYIWSAELYPVSVRAFAMGMFSLAARIGASGSPWVIGVLTLRSYWLPFIVIVTPLAIGTTVGMWLPEKRVIASDIHRNRDHEFRNEIFNIDHEISMRENNMMELKS